MKSMRNIPLCLSMLFLAACFLACGPERPDYVLSDSQMEALLYDYHVAKALGDLESPSNKYKTTIYYMSAFEKHHTTEEQFDSTLAWYSRNPDAFDRVYQRLIKRIQDEKAALDRSIAISGNNRGVTQRGDSVNIWRNVPMFSLTNHEYDNRLTFQYENDENFEDHDTLRLMARFRYVNSHKRINSNEAAIVTLSIRYRNDSIISEMHRVLNDSKHILTLYSNKNGRIREVYGAIYLPKQNENRILLVDSVALIRLHAKEQ